MALTAAVLGPLLLYVLTLPRTVVLEDDGLFLMVGEHLGIAHPPGYPLYTVIIYLFMQLPFGSPAFLGHLSSAVLGALTCGALYICARLLGASGWAALIAAWLLAASEHFWSQAIIAEVYTLNALLFFTTYALLLHGVRHTQQRWLWIAAAVYGLSLANHWPLMVLAFPGIAAMVFTVKRKLLPRLPLLGSVMLGSAAVPYGWMVWRSQQNPLISFYGPIESWSAFWHYISRQGYTGVDVKESARWSDRFEFMQWFGNEMLWQLTLPGFVLAVLGLALLFQRRQLSVAWSGVLVFVGNSFMLIVLLKFDYDSFNVSIFRPYSLVCYGLAALWLALGMQFVLDCLPGWAAETKLFSTIADSPWFRVVAAVLVGLGMTAFSVQTHWSVNNRSENNMTKHYANMIFNLLPENAVLFVSGDIDTAPLGYYRFVEGRRADVNLLNLRGLVYGNRLYPWQSSKVEKKKILSNFIDQTESPVLMTSSSDHVAGHAFRKHGFVLELLKDARPGTSQLIFDPATEDYFEELLKLTPKHEWDILLRNKLLYTYGNYLGFVILSRDTDLLKHSERVRALAKTNFFSLLGLIEVMMEKSARSEWSKIDAWLEQAAQIKPKGLYKDRRGRFLYLQGTSLYRKGERQAAIEKFRESYALYPDHENSAYGALRQLGVTVSR